MTRRTRYRLRKIAGFLSNCALALGCTFVGVAILYTRPNPVPLHPTQNAVASGAVDYQLPLNRQIQDVDLKDVALGQALSELADAAGVSLCIQLPQLATTNSPRAGRLNLTLHHVTLRQAIDRCLTESGQPEFRIYAENGIVTVTMARGDFERMETEFFDVRPS